MCVSCLDAWSTLKILLSPLQVSKLLCILVGLLQEIRSGNLPPPLTHWCCRRKEFALCIHRDAEQTALPHSDTSGPLGIVDILSSLKILG